MRVKLGDFFPRTSYGWSDDKMIRCHKLGAHAVELQGGIAIAALAAEHQDGQALVEGLRRTESAAEQLLKGLPESKDVLNKIKNRSKVLRNIVEPFQYDGVPKKMAKVAEEKLRELGPYELEVEGQTLISCGGKPGYVHFGDKNVKLEPLTKIPVDLEKQSNAKRKKNNAETLRRSAAYHAKIERHLARARKELKK